jgi:hypothetical protein
MIQHVRDWPGRVRCDSYQSADVALRSQQAQRQAIAVVQPTPVPLNPGEGQTRMWRAMSFCVNDAQVLFAEIVEAAMDSLVIGQGWH